MLKEEQIIDARIRTEGFTGEVESLETDPMPTLYSAMQNKLTLQAYPVAVEMIPVKIKTRENEELTHEKHMVPAFVFHFGQEIKGIIPITVSGLLETEEGSDDEAAAEAYLALPRTERNTIKKRMESYLGKLLAFRVLRIEDEVALLSRRDAINAMATRTWREIAKDQECLATVRKILPWGVFCDIGGVTAVIPIREVIHGVVAPQAVLSEGKTYNVKVLEVDKENGRVLISTKALLKDPWVNVPKKYQPRNSYLATLTGRLGSGAGFFVTLEPGVTCIVKHPAFFQPQVGQKVLVYIQHIDPKKKRIFGTIKRLVGPSN